MQKVNRFLYQVQPNEEVTVQITPSINLGRLYAVALDNKPQPKPVDGKYGFRVSKPAGQIHFFTVEFSFDGAPDGARYSLEIDGSGQGNSGPFTTRVLNGDPMLRKQYQFEVTG